MVRGRLWRTSNPSLDPTERQTLVNQLMDARRDVAKAKRTQDDALMLDARQRVHQAKVALGERGPVWWTDGSPDYNRKMARNTPYAAWAEGLIDSD